MISSKSILMVASENDALPNAKVGGIGDVVRDLPPALARLGCTVHVVVPSYGFLHQLPGAELVSHYPIQFGEGVEGVAIYSIPLSSTQVSSALDYEEKLFYWVIEHEDLYPCGVGEIYCDDGDDRPFATDANKYALFCAAVGQAVLNHDFGDLDVIHLHDWHSAFLAILRQYDFHYEALKKIPIVYSIHNLALQGIRPLKNDPSSLERWYPFLQYDRTIVCDPKITHCLNPMRAAIRLADKVHAVSPSYAKEIQKPSRPSKYFFGGEGLEADLVTAARQGRLIGILNGCEYPSTIPEKLTKDGLVQKVRETLLTWVSKTHTLPSAHWLANERLQNWTAKSTRGFIVTSVGRITAQKVRLLQHTVTYGKKQQSVLDHLLDRLGQNGTLLFLGSGNTDDEQFFSQVSGRHDNLIFLRGYSNDLANALYSSGDLFLMPSSFEPCGISQMLAMRAGQPCLVHGVGGLNDTVIDGVSGFMFTGVDGDEQAVNFIERFDAVLTMAKTDIKKFNTIGKAARRARFTWEAAAKEYLASLY